MRGSIRKSGGGWALVVEVGRQECRQCPACGRRHWLDALRGDTCERCGTPLGEVKIERRQDYRYGFRTKREAAAAMAEILSRLNRQAYVAPSKVTVAVYLRDWADRLETSKRRASTVASYRAMLRDHVIPRLGSVRLQALTPGLIALAYGELLKGGRLSGKGGLSPRTVAYIGTILSAALRDAVRENLLTRNPAADVARPSSRAPEMRTWTVAEARTFLNHVRGDRLSAGWHVLVSTGLRRGELLGLGWGDVDLDGATISVRRSLVSVGDKLRFEEPKTGAGRRRVDLDPGTVAALRAHHRRQAEERLAWGPAYADGDLVFAQEDGQPLHPDRFSDLFARTLKGAGVPKIRVHDVRHTHATLALSAGVPARVVQERLGHSSVAVTLGTYSHVLPGIQAEAAAKIAALIDG